MKVLEVLNVSTKYPYDVYVAYQDDITFKNILGKRTFKNYIYKIHIAQAHGKHNLFKLRMDAVRGFYIHSDYYVKEGVDISKISLAYTTVWAFQMVTSRVEINGREAIIQQKKYNLLSGLDCEDRNDRLIGIK